jgi:hypothetical protein
MRLFFGQAIDEGIHASVGMNGCIGRIGHQNLVRLTHIPHGELGIEVVNQVVAFLVGANQNIPERGQNAVTAEMSTGSDAIISG